MGSIINQLQLDQVWTGVCQRLPDLDRNNRIFCAMEKQNRHVQLVGTIHIVDGVEVEPGSKRDEQAPDGHYRITNETSYGESLT